jgi:poly(A) polymerase
MTDALARLKEENIPYLVCSYSCLDRYFRLRDPGSLFVATDSSLVALARAFEDLQFPGLPLEDAAVQNGFNRLVFRCVDTLALPPSAPFTVQRLLFDPARNVFLDKLDLYPDLRSRTLTFVPDSYPRWLALCEAAKLVSRYHYTAEDLRLGWEAGNELPPAGYQKDLLESLLTSRAPEKGFAFLEASGFVEAAWPELHAMTEVPHGKDYHPEGNVWEHTLATFRHRKHPDLTLSLSLLLHDSGKPVSENTGDKRFDGHAELGARIAARFLRRLEFSDRVVEPVEFLVRYHMMPAALKILPPFRTEKIFASPLFPTLLELYRADLSSSYADEEEYYEACRIYRAWQRDKGNPYLAEKMRKRARAARR